MGKVRFDRLLAGTALAVVFAVSMPAAFAGPETEQAIEAKVPVPEPADVKPITPADVDNTGSTPVVAQPPAAAPAPAATPAPAPAPAPEVTQAPPAATPAPAAAPTQAVQSKPAEAKPVVEAAAPATDAVTDKIRELITAKGDRSFLKHADKAGAEAYYSAHKFAPLWVTDAGPTERGKAAVAYLKTIDTEGLDPADYPIPAFKAGDDPAALADAELKLTAAVLGFARHALTGRIAFSRVSADIGYQLKEPDADDILGKLADARNVAATLASFNPQQPQYKALKAQLAKVRAKSEAPQQARIAPGQKLKLAKTPMQDGRVPALRERLGLPAKAGDTTYDRQLAEAVAKFQEQHGLKADGILGNSTVEAMNGPKSQKLEDVIIVNMERWRWMPRDLGKNYVMLNIPDYTLRVMKDGQLYWHTKVVVGKPAKPTPLLSASMSYITVNPTWNVPPSIVYGEYLPAMQQDPTVMERMGMKVTQSSDGGVHIAQPPGDGNALGRLRFNFPNKFMVYQHDTPDKYLFARYPRAYSHGCMRVENPPKYAEVVLSLVLPKEGYTESRIKSMYGPSEIDIKFPTPLPVHITYQTAFVDDNGNLQLRDDIYGRDARMIAILKGDERRIADVPVDHPEPSYLSPAVTLPPGVLASNGNSGFGNSGPNFFEMLFGGGQHAQPQPQPVQRRRVTRRVNTHDLTW